MAIKMMNDRSVLAPEAMNALREFSLSLPKEAPS